MTIEQMTQNLTTKQLIIFNRVMQSSYYYPSDATKPEEVTLFYTEYFEDIAHEIFWNENEDRETSIFVSIEKENLNDFIDTLISTIKSINAYETNSLLVNAHMFEAQQYSPFEPLVDVSAKTVVEFLQYRTAAQSSLFASLRKNAA